MLLFIIITEINEHCFLSQIDIFYPCFLDDEIKVQRSLVTFARRNGHKQKWTRFCLRSGAVHPVPCFRFSLQPLIFSDKAAGKINALYGDICILKPRR